MFIKNIGSFFVITQDTLFNFSVFCAEKIQKIKDLIHMDKVFWCR